MTTEPMTLIEKLEAATEGSRKLDGEVANAAGWRFERRIPNRNNWWYAPGDETNYGGRSLAPKFTTSIDAALTLVPKRGDLGLTWRFHLEQKPMHSGPGWFCEIREHAKEGGDAVSHTPALAICIAALKARGSQ